MLCRDMKVRQVLEWSASEQDRNVCLVKGKSELSCQNYIKVSFISNKVGSVLQMTVTVLLICLCFRC